MRAILNGELMVTLMAAALFSVPVMPWLMQRWVALPTLRPWPRVVSAWRYSLGSVVGLGILMLSALKILTSAYSPFIYFRF